MPSFVSHLHTYWFHYNNSKKYQYIRCLSSLTLEISIKIFCSTFWSTYDTDIMDNSRSCMYILTL